MFQAKIRTVLKFSTRIMEVRFVPSVRDCFVDTALITRVPLSLFSFAAPRGTRRNGLATVRSTGVVWQQMGKVSMAVRSAAMSHIGCLRFWDGRHVLLLYRQHTFREVVPATLPFLSPLHMSPIIRVPNFSPLIPPIRIVLPLVYTLR